MRAANRWPTRLGRREGVLTPPGLWAVCVQRYIRMLPLGSSWSMRSFGGVPIWSERPVRDRSHRRIAGQRALRRTVSLDRLRRASASAFRRSALQKAIGHVAGDLLGPIGTSWVASGVGLIARRIETTQGRPNDREPALRATFLPCNLLRSQARRRTMIHLGTLVRRSAARFAVGSSLVPGWSASP